ncbi:Peptidase family M23 [Streptomyces sp. WMMB 714]|nr:Peptidase family M23 [Streptomyces sp. WMMB 714]
MSICGFAGTAPAGGNRGAEPVAHEAGSVRKGQQVPSEPAVDDYTRPISRAAPVTARWGVPGGWAAGHHTGVDFAASPGTVVRSVGTGRVELAGEAGSYGKAVIVHMKDGKHVLFAHLSKITVRLGRVVRANTVLGESGNTGRSTGPHLHFEVRAQRGYGTEVDPVTYLARHGVRIA